MAGRPSIAVLCDSPDENWRAMDLAAEMLVREWALHFGDRVEALPFSIDLPRIARRVPGLHDARSAFNFDRLVGRFGVYPASAAWARRGCGFYHVVDHTYAQVVHALPSARTGVFCHDLDAFRSLLRHSRDERPAWFRAMQRATLTGMQSAAVVFYTTKVVRDEIEREGLLPADRLVQASLGISPEFTAAGGDDPVAADVLAALGGRPYLLHVGSAVPRKRLDVLFETFARLRARHPDLLLVQNGAALSAEQHAHIERLGIAEAFHQPSRSRIARASLAQLYRHAAAVLVTSDAEGFGIPAIEALACGAVVFTSDIPVLLEVCGGAAVHCRVGEPEAWAETVHRFLAGELTPPSHDARLAQAAKFTWKRHAATILGSYEALARESRVGSN